MFSSFLPPPGGPVAACKIIYNIIYKIIWKILITRRPRLRHGRHPAGRRAHRRGRAWRALPGAERRHEAAGGGAGHDHAHRGTEDGWETEVKRLFATHGCWKYLHTYFLLTTNGGIWFLENQIPPLVVRRKNVCRHFQQPCVAKSFLTLAVKRRNSLSYCSRILYNFLEFSTVLTFLPSPFLILNIM